MKLFLDWSGYKEAGLGDAYADIPKTGGDYAKAIAVCIGSKACEEKGRGVMCPSFRITDNGQLSTGGRVKLLKSALNGELGQLPFQHPELAEAMDLCVSCKGCRRECENEVDMALIKAEYIAQRFSQSGFPIRNRLFAALPKLVNQGSWFKNLIKWRNRSAILARLGDVVFGISAQMPLPEPASQPFKHSPDSMPAADYSQSTELVLFVDTFNRYFNPAVAEAAIAVLSKAGYRVHILQAVDDTTKSARPLCCGRTYFNNGMIDKARGEAQRLLQALTPHLQAGRVVIGLEPSCILSLRDEHLKLGLGEKSHQLASKVLLFEEFIGKEITAKRWFVKFNPLENSKLLVHGHCHQKAVGATKAMRKVLKQIPELDSTPIESTCCGMAGQFGLESEHAKHAREMAEQGLFPALRDEPEAAVLANGFSCQQQICNAGFKPPRHIAELLYAALD